jgi:hypothetical protein
MAVGDKWRISIIGRVHGQRTMNSFYYSQVGGVGIAGLALGQNLLNAVLAADWWDFYLDLHSNEWSAIEATTQQYTEFENKYTPQTPLYVHDIVDAAGGYVGTALPTSVALVIRRRTELPGRAGYGRIYLTGVPQDWEEDSLIDTDDVNFSAAIVGFTANINLDLVNAGITWSPRHLSLSLPGGGSSNIIREWTYDDVLRNQRRRQIGRGE